MIYVRCISALMAKIVLRKPKLKGVKIYDISHAYTHSNKHNYICIYNSDTGERVTDLENLKDMGHQSTISDGKRK